NWSGLTKMLTTTRSAAARARRTKLRCPRWIAPIVGTNATRRPCRRHRLTTRRTVGIAAVTITAGSPPRSIRFLLGGESAGLHVGDVALERLADGLGQARVTANELGLVAQEQAEQVVAHEHLAVAADPRADADRRDRERARHLRAQPGRDALEHDREATGLLQHLRLAQQALLIGLAARLHLVAAHRQDGVRRETEM